MAYVCMPECVMESKEAREEVRSSETGGANACELPCGFWDMNSGPLQDQPVLSADPSL